MKLVEEIVFRESNRAEEQCVPGDVNVQFSYLPLTWFRSDP
jgi:hypothetical protein